MSSLAMPYTKPFNSNVLNVYTLGECYIITFLSKCRISGYEKYTLEQDAFNFQHGSFQDVKPKNIKCYGEKFQANCSRAYTAIKELAFANNFDLFVTLTFDKEKVMSRFDRKQLIRAVCDWFRDYARNRNIPKLKYLLVPEQHKNGAWHIHGFISGIREKDLHLFCIGDIMSSEIASKVKSGEKVYNWLPYSKKFGYCSLTPIQSVEKSVCYISKYITKELAESVKKGEHLYYCSRGLIRKQLVQMLTGVDPTYIDWDFVSAPENIGLPKGYIRKKLLRNFNEYEACMACVTLFDDGVEYDNDFMSPYTPEFWNDGFMPLNANDGYLYDLFKDGEI